MTNSADPNQLASSEANWSGSTLFAKIEHVLFTKRRVKKAYQTRTLIFVYYLGNSVDKIDDSSLLFLHTVESKISFPLEKVHIICHSYFLHLR